MLGVTEATVLHWEKGYTQPAVYDMPAIVAFLGYDPLPSAQTLGERMRAKRRHMGWTIGEAAEALGVHPDSWSEWERGRAIKWPRFRATVHAFLGMAQAPGGPLLPVPASRNDLGH